MKQKELLAYLEGQLPTSRRLLVYRRLQRSSRLRSQLDQLSHTRKDLQQELALVGRDTNLSALLPSILKQNHCNSQKRLEWGLNLFAFLSLIALLAFLTPIVLSSNGAAQASGGLQMQNIPAATHTPNPNCHPKTETPQHVSRVVGADRQTIYIIYVQQAASPVPMPNATIEVSEVAYQDR